MSERIVSLHAGYDHDDRLVDGYVARPAGVGIRPAVVLISGMSGLNWFQRQITRTFAEAGFVALSPDLFDGAHPQGRAQALLQKNSLDIDRAIGDVTVGARFLRDLPWVDADARVGVVGFCLGGGLALLSLGRTDVFGAGVIYYHSLFPDPEELEGIDASLLCHYGAADHTTPREEVDAFTAALDRYEKQYEVAFYEGAGHSFLNPGSDPLPAQQRAREASLERTFAFLREELARGVEG